MSLQQRQRAPNGRAAPIQIWPGTGIAALVAGSAWVAFVVGGRLSSEDYMACASTFGRAMNAVETIAYLALIPALLGLYAAYRRSGNSWLAVTGPIAAVGFAMAGVTNLMEHCFVSSIALPLPLFRGFSEPSPYILGLLLTWFFLPFTLALTRVSWIPTWSAWGLVIGFISFWAANSQGGAVILGAAWIILGAYLVAHRTSTSHGATAEGPASASLVP